MPDQGIFCNSPWYELQIYWDGSLGFCCQASHKIYPSIHSETYNIRNTTIKQWFDSEPMKLARRSMFGSTQNSFCSRCYHEELASGSSRRHRSNQKSVIFTKSNFLQSYEQSPGFDKFEYSRQNQGVYDGMPIDLHIDLGNYCNLTCKMCAPQASSSIASQHVKWGIDSAKKFIGTDWTRDDSIWHRTLDELAGLPSLKNVHFMGGETLITPRFENFIDFMIDRKRVDINVSFVTNGTTFNARLMEKLQKFQRVGIEVSIETLTEHNGYQRQGTDTSKVLANIDRYLGLCDSTRISLTARPTLSLFTIGTYYTLLGYCLDKKLVVKSLLCTDPRCYSVEILPKSIKNMYIERYRRFCQDNDLDSIDCSRDFNESDSNEIKKIIKNQINQCINLLGTETPSDSESCLEKMVLWSKRWDQVHSLDARDLYPEFAEIYNQYGY
jgi:sulfatase maturation enzyme AslB (radical SAM superfamily)